MAPCGRAGAVLGIAMLLLAGPAATLTPVTSLGACAAHSDTGAGAVSSARCGPEGACLCSPACANCNATGIASLGFVRGLAASTSALFLGHNAIAAVPETVFDGLSSLRTLDLSANAITALERNTFRQLTALVELNLRGNQLSALPAGLLREQVSLEGLDLSANAITALPAGLFARLPHQRLLYVLLDGNMLARPGNVLTALDEARVLNVENRSSFLLSLANNPVLCRPSLTAGGFACECNALLGYYGRRADGACAVRQEHFFTTGVIASMLTQLGIVLLTALAIVGLLVHRSRAKRRQALLDGEHAQPLVAAAPQGQGSGWALEQAWNRRSVQG